MADQPDYENQVTRIGRKGLQLSFAPDAIDPEAAQDLVNLRSRLGGPLETRPGQSTLGTAGSGLCLGLARVDDPARADWTRYAYCGTALRSGRDAGTGWTSLVTGLSGSPPTLLPYRIALTGEPWLILADAAMMRKIRKVGGTYEVSDLGIAPPASMTSVISDLLTTSIAAFDGSDNTEAADWTPTGGTDFSEPPIPLAAPPTLTDVAGLSGAAVMATFNPGAAGPGVGYYSFLGIAKAMDLTKLQGGTFDAFDQDYIRLLLKVDQPEVLDELRIYFVVSTGFDATVVPGTDPAINTDAYVKSIRVHDYTDFTAVLEDAVTAGERSRRTTEVQSYLDQGGFTPPAVEPLVSQDPLSGLYNAPSIADDPTGGYITPSNDKAALPTQTTSQLSPGAGAWSEIGRLGKPLRRGEFMRIGNATARTWATVTGIVIVAVTNTNVAVSATFDDWFLTGGFGPDAGPPEAIPYDWRATHYDLRTGSESNPTDVQINTLRLQPQRQRLTLTAPAFVGGDATYMRQRFYRRGGLLPDDWYYIGQSATNGGQVIDIYNDTEVQAAGRLQVDNDQPVQTVNFSGAVVRSSLGQLFGPLDGVLYGVGDPYRPGTAYWSKVDNPDAWPVDNQVDVCPASERLVAGCLLGDTAYVFSTARMYALRPNVVAGGAVTVAQPTACSEGLVGARGLTVTPLGIAFVALDGIRLTTGGQSQLLSAGIDPLFRDQVVAGYNPVDLTNTAGLALTCWETELWFCYVEQTSGTRRVMVYDLLEQQWRNYSMASIPTALFYEEAAGGELLMGSASAAINLHTGASDNGTPISQRVMTGAWDFNLPRLEKQLGDVIVDVDWPVGSTPNLQVKLNNATLSDVVQTATPPAGRRRYHFEPFGIVPQRARNVQLDFQWSSSTTARLWFAGVSYIPEPEQTINRPTPWDTLSGGTGYCTGMLLTCDTYGVARTVIVEITVQNVLVQALTTVVSHTGRRAIYYSWPVVKGEQVRLRPTADCQGWLFYDVQWISTAEPPYIALWDSNDEAKGDTYYTGLDLVCDTHGVDKTIVIYVDGVQIASRIVNALGKQLVHLTFGSGRGHIYRFIAIDDSPGRLYSWEWMLQAEPGEQTNWNQNYTVAGTLSDKWVKGVLLECDTYGEDKVVEVQVDQTTVETLAVNQAGRGVLQFSFPQHKGRVFRLWPIDANPGRLYTLQWVFDQEPLSLLRWETQELDHSIPSWFMPLRAMLTIRSSAQVDFTVTLTNQLGVVLSTTTYAVPSTANLKVKTWVPFVAAKGALVKYSATSSVAFWLYREESHVMVQPLGGDQPAVQKPLGNDDQDHVRGMMNATLEAARAGGGSG